nr:ribonuclease H-like domain-containing protein [Tanacetum cinerariifolium]
MIYRYKLALAQVEARLAELRNQELKYCEKIRVPEFRTESSTDCIENLKKELELIKKEKEGIDTKLTGFQTASKDLDSLLESQRLDKNNKGLGYSSVPPPPAQIYSPPKKDISWIGLLESSSSTISPKPFIKFVKANDSPTKSKTYMVKIAKKPPVKYAEQYKKPIKKPNVRGNQRNWNNLKSHQLGPNFVMEKKACFNCGDFNHLAYDCRKRDSDCSRHMTYNISYLSDYEPFDGGYVSFGQGGCKITGKGTIKT